MASGASFSTSPSTPCPTVTLSGTTKRKKNCCNPKVYFSVPVFGKALDNAVSLQGSVVEKEGKVIVKSII